MADKSVVESYCVPVRLRPLNGHKVNVCLPCLSVAWSRLWWLWVVLSALSCVCPAS